MVTEHDLTGCFGVRSWTCFVDRIVENPQIHEEKRVKLLVSLDVRDDKPAGDGDASHYPGKIHHFSLGKSTMSTGPFEK